MVAQTQNPIKMKTLNDGTSKGLNYDERVNTVDARTVPTTSETPSYLVDKRLIDFLISQALNVSLDEVKQQAKNMIDQAPDVATMAKDLEEFFYINKVLTMLEPEASAEEEAPKAPVTNEFRADNRSHAERAHDANNSSPIDYSQAH